MIALYSGACHLEPEVPQTPIPCIRTMIFKVLTCDYDVLQLFSQCNLRLFMHNVLLKTRI